MERMSALDAAFGELEDTDAALAIASAAVFSGPAPGLDAILHLFRHKIHLLPRMRQRMRAVPFGVGRPLWVDDPDFDVRRHVHAAVLARPGGTEELTEFVGQLMSTRLDPERPLWQIWVVDGLARGRWALVFKIHHSMSDGLSGIAMLNRIFDESPNAPLPAADHWVPESQPRAGTLLRSAAHQQARARNLAISRLVRAMLRPDRSGRELVGAARGLGGYLRALRPGPRSGLNGSLTAQRQFCVAEARLSDVAVVRAAFGGTINDVVLAMVASGLRALFEQRGTATTEHLVRCMVPVSVRTADSAGGQGGLPMNNEVSAVFADLPVEFADPQSRYSAVVTRIAQLKSSHEAQAGVLLSEVADLIPPPLLALGLHAAFRLPQRSLATIVTNVPGPRRPLYALGARMLANYPYVPIANHVRLATAVTSYDGRLYLGITSDPESMPDVAVMRDGVERGLAELVAVADAHARTAR